ncbi:MAG: acetolactate synthase small subunit [Lachnospiraceae bacterium]|nr:acetolactate synthase small subunit [Lachnospiraceae bacterium]
MRTKVIQLLVDNRSGVLSRISGLFARRGYNIESITAGVTSVKNITRITIVTAGDEDILDQIEKQVRKLVDVIDVRELEVESSVFRELCLIKIKADNENRNALLQIVDRFHCKLLDISPDSLIAEITGSRSKIDGFLTLVSDYEILEVARTGLAGLARGNENESFLENQMNGGN